jgi:uncharacterized phage infection (PIP) family protein YhgE
LWKIALMVEEGNLQDAFDRLQRAQDRLDEAIKNGASPEEIDQLMKEMQQALNDYMRELAEEAQRNPGDQQQSQMMQGQMMSGDQLKEMLDKLQQLMEEGKTAEAAELMEQLRQLMQNMQVVQGQQGQGQGSRPEGHAGPGRHAARPAGPVRRCLPRPAGRPASRRGTGTDQGQGQEQGQDQGRGTSRATSSARTRPIRAGQWRPGLASDRQRGLRERLNQLQNGDLPGDGTERARRAAATSTAPVARWKRPRMRCATAISTAP